MESWNYSTSAQKQDSSTVDLSGCPDSVKGFVGAFERIYESDKKN
jgi:hypothetical protein